MLQLRKLPLVIHAVVICTVVGAGASASWGVQAGKNGGKDDQSKQEGQQANEQKPPPPKKFRPPPGPAPATRTKGAVRGGDKGVPEGEVVVLAPAKVMGLTTRERPVLFWSLSRPTTQPVQITINNLATDESVVDVTLEGGRQAGMHKFDTAEAAKKKPFKLEPGVRYEVVVMIVGPEGVTASSAASTCRIMRMDPAKAPKLPDSASAAARADAYADAGAWFDYLAALEDLLAARPQEQAWRQARDALLKDEALPSAAPPARGNSSGEGGHR